MTIAILLLLAADITGHVTGADAQTEVRIRGNGVEVKSARPDAKGSFTFRNAAAGYNLVEAMSWQGKALSYAFADWKGQPVELKMAPVKPLTGRVALKSGKPLPKGIEVEIPGEITVKVGVEGAFNLGVLPPDLYEVNVTHAPEGLKARLRIGTLSVPGNEVDLRKSAGPLVITLE